MLDSVREPATDRAVTAPASWRSGAGIVGVHARRFLIFAAPLRRFADRIADVGVASQAAILDVYPILDTMM